MNLALLDPFRRQIPDRIDSTLTLPPHYHPSHTTTSAANTNHPSFSTSSNNNNNNGIRTSLTTSSSTPSYPMTVRDGKGGEEGSTTNNTNNNNETTIISPSPSSPIPHHDTTATDNPQSQAQAHTSHSNHACYAVSFNRRGTYLAAGHASGTVPVHDFASRILSCIYLPTTTTTTTAPNGKTNANTNSNTNANTTVVNSISWSRRSRRLLSGGVGSPTVKLLENGHPFGIDDLASGPNSQSHSHPYRVVEDGHVGGGGGNSGGEEEETMSIASVESTKSGSASVMKKRGGKKDKRGGAALATAATVGGSGSAAGRLVQSLGRVRYIQKVLVLDLVGRGSDDAVDHLDEGEDDDHCEDEDGVDAPGRSKLSKWFMTPFERAIWNKKPQEKTLEERHQYALLKMRMSGSTPTPTSSSSAPVISGDGGKHAKHKKRKHSSENDKEDLPHSKKKKKSTHSATATPNKSESHKVTLSSSSPSSSSSQSTLNSKWYQTLVLSLPRPVAGSVQIHPDGNAGLACLDDGSLVLFYFPTNVFPESSFMSGTDKASNAATGTGTGATNRPDGVATMLYLVLPFKTRSVSAGTGGGSSSNSSGNHSPKKGSSSSPSSVSSRKKSYFVTCAAFCKSGKVVYAATKCGTLLGFRIPPSVMNAMATATDTTTIPSASAANTNHFSSLASQLPPTLSSSITPIPNCKPIQPSFTIKIPGGATAWQMVMSRNGQMLLINSSDCAIRLYDINECWDLVTKPSLPDKDSSSSQPYINRIPKKDGHVPPPPPIPTSTAKPKWTFQNVVSKVPWECCDFSGDGEYVVGGCNEKGNHDKYELYLWNTATGSLLDQLTGPQVSIHSLSWHPTRSFIAVGTSDGLVDIWGPRMDWTAFAPDFQALPKNVEYIEREDEFDIVVDGDGEEEMKRREMEDKMEEMEVVDVMTVDSVAVFDSDSESESDVFYFPTRIVRPPSMLGGSGMKR